MKRFLVRILKYLMKALIAAVVIGLVSYLISKLTGMPLAETMQYAGIACILVGLLSIEGKMKMTTDPTYMQSRSVSKSIIEGTAEDFRSRDGNFNFMAFMLGTAALLIGFSFFF